MGSMNSIGAEWSDEAAAVTGEIGSLAETVTVLIKSAASVFTYFYCEQHVPIAEAAKSVREETDDAWCVLMAWRVFYKRLFKRFGKRTTPNEKCLRNKIKRPFGK